MRLGALEAGGTKMVCAIGDESGKIYEQVSIPTETPEITMPRLISYFEERKIEALGIGCFGPIDPDKKSETYGYITSTPKLAWADYNIVGTMEKSLMIPVGFDTDVNGSVLGEVTFGQAKGKKCVVYVTIGTGVGAGIYIEGKLCGFIGCHNDGSMGMLYVEDAYRRQGLAASLEGYLINKQREQGMIPYAHIVNGNEASIQLQERLGLNLSETVIWWLYR